jgi:hypothetical protein
MLAAPPGLGERTLQPGDGGLIYWGRKGGLMSGGPRLVIVWL